MSGPLNMMSTATQTQVVAITAVNFTGDYPRAQGYTRQQTYVDIDLRYHVGAIHVVPRVGEQWYLQRMGKSWALDRKLPPTTMVLNTIADNPVPGQVQIG